MVIYAKHVILFVKGSHAHVWLGCSVTFVVTHFTKYHFVTMYDKQLASVAVVGVGVRVLLAGVLSLPFLKRKGIRACDALTFRKHLVPGTFCLVRFTHELALKKKRMCTPMISYAKFWDDEKLRDAIVVRECLR